ncbi:hypothetical protein CSQ80_16320 [Cyanobacterium aponinum IPPAS B-1201]|nr:hypothetical protein CSQ80_16320 [Cyanobacterium aponinum IPPAS B-1201]
MALARLVIPIVLSNVIPTMIIVTFFIVNFLFLFDTSTLIWEYQELKKKIKNKFNASSPYLTLSPMQKYKNTKTQHFKDLVFYQYSILKI